MSPAVDVSFPITTRHPIPADHAYLLYSAVSRVLPELHGGNGFGIHPIRGQQIGGRTLRLCDFSRLTIRTPADRIGELLPLAGKQLKMLDRSLRVGVPQVRPLIPATALRSRLVVIKVAHIDAKGLTEDIFTAAARKKLDALGVSREVRIVIPRRDDRPIRRTLRIKDKQIVGYEVLLEGLTAEESLNVQEAGLGGRRHMGCGIFVKFDPRTI